jgi:hypothetical protein
MIFAYEQMPCADFSHLPVQDLVEAFCERVPGSVLARRYSDFAPEKLHEIYINANPKVLK